MRQPGPSRLAPFALRLGGISAAKISATFAFKVYHPTLIAATPRWVFALMGSAPAFNLARPRGRTGRDGSPSWDR